MTETKIELSSSCSFTLTTYENIGYKDVCLDYTEHSSDHWYSDIETSISLDANKALEIVAFMQKAFPEIEQTAQQDPVAGVVLRDGQPTLLQDKHIKETDERLFRAAPPAQQEPSDLDVWRARALQAEAMIEKFMEKNT